MFITFGLDANDTPDRIREYVKYGVEEFFAGFVPRDWLSKYGWEVCPNRRPLGGGYNFTQVSELAEMSEAVHKAGARLNLAINAHDNGSERVPYLRDMVETMEQFNPDGYVVADPAIMFCLKEWGIRRPLHISTGTGCFSMESIKFFSDKFNIRRVVIPRKLSISEIARIVEQTRGMNVELEVMIIGYRCYFNDENCHSIHSGARRNLCGDMLLAKMHASNRFPDDWKDVATDLHASGIEVFKEGTRLNEFARHLTTNQMTPYDYSVDLCANGCGVEAVLPKTLYQNCGLCSIKHFRDMGIDCLKVPLRGATDFKVPTLAIVHAAMTAPDPNPDFCRKLINSPAFCDARIHCYYDVPEAHVKRENG
jgi:hypothetical protein